MKKGAPKDRTPKKHHYAPKFYLARWASFDNAKLWAISRNIDGSIKRERKSPGAIGFEYHLYSYEETLKVENRAEIETKFFSPLDNEGAKISTKFICGAPLETHEWTLWAQFLSGMKFRTPENIDKLKRLSLDYLTGALERGQKDYYETLRSPADPPHLADWVRARKPGLMENMGLMELPSLVARSEVLDDIQRMEWYAVDFKSAAYAILTSDRPLVITKGLGDPECIIALPLSPQCVFFAFYPSSKAKERLMGVPIDKLAEAVNQNTVSQAKKYACSYHANDATDEFYQQ